MNFSSIEHVTDLFPFVNLENACLRSCMQVLLEP